jgi:hypothetical protein
MTQTYAYPHHVDLYVEDFLQDRDVFGNFLNDRSTNPGAYMSYIDWLKWDSCKMELLDAFGSLALREASKIFADWAYMSPTFPELASLINQLLAKYPDRLPTHPEKMGDPDITTLQTTKG